MSMNRSSRLFISWAPFCSRSDNIARELGGVSVMIYHGFWGSRYLTVGFKYASQSIATLWLLWKMRPTCVFVMSPPPVASLVVGLYARLFRISYVIDAHTATFIDKRWRLFEFLQRYLSRKAMTTLVTNTHWQTAIQRWGARSDILADVPVIFPKPKPLELGNGFHVAVVATFTWDEPIETIFEAARLVPTVSFHVTGNYRRLNAAITKRKPQNVRFTGFMPDDDYVSLIMQSHAVMSLTVLDHTMQRGAYEAAYLGRPVITSNFELLRESFTKGAVFVDGTASSIADGVGEMRNNIVRYQREAEEFAEEKLLRWQTTKQNLELLVRQA